MCGDKLVNEGCRFLTIWSLVATLYTVGLNIQQEGQCTYNVTLRRVRVTIVAMGKR